MKYGTLVVMFCALMCAMTVQAVTVDGNVFLSGQSDHSGTWIVFRAASPSAATDSTSSANDGHYSLALQPGVYDVEFGHAGFAAFTLAATVLLYNTTLPAENLMSPLSGSLSGVIGPGDFDVVDTIRVERGTSLQIAAGTRLFVRANLPLHILGVLRVTGTVSDSVVFTSRHLPDLWRGIFFETLSQDTGSLDYAVIEYGHFAVGGNHSSTVAPSVVFDHCAIRRNGNDWGDQTMFWDGAYTRIGNSVFVDNVYSSALVSRHGSLFVTDCRFENNQYGVCLTGDSTAEFALHNRITGCYFADNRVAADIHAGVLEECIFEGCPDNQYNIIYCRGYGMILQSTILGGMYIGGNNINVASNIIAYAQTGPGIEFDEATHARVMYNCIFDNAGGPFTGDSPSGFGIVALTTANGDSCDTYYNIYFDPELANVPAGDYHLTAESPCINVGDPLLPHDPDGTIADMGALYYNVLPVPETGLPVVCGYELSQNYPNPFNGQTMIRYELKQAGLTTLRIYNLLGQEVATVVNDVQTAGAHHVNFAMNDLASGVYVYRLESGDFRETRKMMLMK